MGDSRGHFDGHTLVVDVRSQSAKGRFDMVGNCASDSLHLVERWTLVDSATIADEATIEGGTVYTRAWPIGSRLIRGLRGEGGEYREEACHDGERRADAMILKAPDSPGDNKP